MLIKNTLLLLPFFFINFNYAANILPESHAVNGGITIIPVESREKPEALFNNTRVPTVESIKPNQWLLIVGIPLEIENEINQVKITQPQSAIIPFYVSHKMYKTQKLTIQDQRKVTPLNEDKVRISKEEQHLANLFTKYSQENPFKEGFKAPLKGPVSSLFGLKRIYNNEPRPPHSGLDIVAPEGTPVLAVNTGNVVETWDYFYTGNTVILDHGMGVFSLYGHLKDIQVKIGDKIQQGQVLGTVGQTGRATGPHLHWSMILNKTMVDPLLFVNYQFINTPLPKPQTADKKSDVRKAS